MDRDQLFRKAFDENRQRIFRICCHYFPNRDDCNDAYQESLVRLWENLSGFRGDAALSTWIYRVVVNVCLSYIRQEKKRGQTVSVAAEIPDDLTTHHDETNESSDPDKFIFFRQFMSTISGADRILVTLYLEEVSTREMAEVTGLTEANVRVRIHRIKETIRKQWEEYYHGTR
jgi:RNA polymerase sigma-70 factor (ECF subfamily)